MLEQREIEAGLADMLRSLRQKKGYSKERIANELYIDARTWARYERGETSPTAAELIRFYSLLNEDLLRPVLNLIYPNVYGEITDTAAIRQAAAHYLNNVASDRILKQLEFIAIGGHGSNIAPQMQLFTAICHLPIAYRIAVAELALTLYEVADSRNELVCNGKIMPDIDLLKDGITAAKAAAAEFSDSYTTVSK